MSKKLLPLLNSKLLYKMGYYFLDPQYMRPIVGFTPFGIPIIVYKLNAKCLSNFSNVIFSTDKELETSKKVNWKKAENDQYLLDIYTIA